ncbi:hypothetical protein BDN67DRAFT_965027 [Paxillus ammoniavirescens]|nr:hypothetical protein BDN67DRAFT_965027 [Paxillus ammoniavirescens]
MAGYSKFQKAIAHYSIASVGLIRCWFATLFKRAHNVYFISVGSIDIIECSPLVPRTHRMFQRRISLSPHLLSADVASIPGSFFERHSEVSDIYQ